MSSCSYNVRDFPVDSQTRTAEFSSLSNINITTSTAFVLDSSQNLAWSVDDVSDRREIKLLWGGAYTYTLRLFDILDIIITISLLASFLLQ